MKIFKTENNTAQNESDGILSSLPEEKSSLGARFDETIEISSLGPFHHQIVVVVVTEGVVHAGYEVAFEPFQDILLQFYVLHQLFLLDLTLLHLFYGIGFSSFLASERDIASLVQTRAHGPLFRVHLEMPVLWSVRRLFTSSERPM